MGRRREGRGRVERLLARLPAPRPNGPVATVLCYHALDPDGGPHTSATPTGFAHHLDWLAEQAEVIALGDVADALTAPPGPRPVVALTFDDGYEDNHRHALPALAERGLTATFFVTSGFIDDLGDTRDRMARSWAEPPPTVRAMTWSQVRELAAAGMDIGGHTRTHRNLAGLSPTDIALEIESDRDRIEQHIGRPVTSLAYPFGRPGHDVTAAVTGTTRRLGYERAVTVSFSRVGVGTSRWALPRIPVHHDDTDLLAAKLDGRLDRLGRIQDGRPQAAAAEPAA